MDHIIKYDLFTIDGNALLVQAGSQNSTVLLDADLFASISEYRESALLYQIRKVLESDNCSTPLEKVFFFVDFDEFFRWKDKERNIQFDQLMQAGFHGIWFGEDTQALYVPFEKSQSQAKKCVISFIRADLFTKVRERLDLSICFGDMKMAAGLYAGQECVLPALSKLYAYRGLYLTEATRLEGEEIRRLLDEDRIIILDEARAAFRSPNLYEKPSAEIAQARQMRLYSKKTETTYKANSVVDLDMAETIIGNVQDDGIDDDRIKITSLFDGAGIISPYGAWILNQAMGIAPSGKTKQENITTEYLSSKNLALSFQFRMPFCKGMLHTVDFHDFIINSLLEKNLLKCCEEPPTPERRKQLKKTAEQMYQELEIQDVFGVTRKIAKADIILNTSLFKLYKLLKGRSRGPELITHYFQKIKEYDHSIYIAKTDLQQRYTGYTNLTYQILNTLRLDGNAFDRLVDLHLARARTYDLNAIVQGQWNAIGYDQEVEETDRVHKYLKANSLLSLDSYVNELIDSCRKQKIDALSQGKLEVAGDMRFLCRDLLYWLCRIAEKCRIQGKPVWKEFILTTIDRGQVYLPGLQKKRPSPLVPERCAVFRSPHLSPNENVFSIVAKEDDLHRKYLGHLRRVAFLGAFSHMHSALGGADFDGDMVVVAFQPEVVDACEKNCYREDGKDSLELIDIPSLNDDASTASTDFLYVDVQTIHNTFSSSIGIISNAAMKICAAEQALESLGLSAAVTGSHWLYPSKYCAILNGTEIDAAKSGIRPNLEGVSSFVLRPSRLVAEAAYLAALADTDEESARQLAPKATQMAQEAMDMVGQFLHIKDELKDADLTLATVTLKIDQQKKAFFSVDRETSHWMTHIASIDAADVENKPLIYRLLIRWAQARVEEAENHPKKGYEAKKKAVEHLFFLLEPGDTATAQEKAAKTGYKYPRSDILKKLVFRCPRMSSTEANSLSEVLLSCQKTKEAVSAVGLETSKDMRKNIRKRMLYLLQFKYDNIDETKNGQNTIRQVSAQIAEKLKNELKTSEAVEARLEQLFYEQENSQAWLYMDSNSRKQTLLDAKVAQTDDRQEVQVFSDFYYRGYNLLYFALREALVKVKAEESIQLLSQNGTCSFHSELLVKAKTWLSQGYTTAQINNRLLPQVCKEELIRRGGTDLPQLIRKVYSCAKETQKKMVWQIFTWDEIRACLEVTKSAQ